jgi:acyl-CoA synthetase (AMP-forming)/AMP-acid ligase II
MTETNGLAATHGGKSLAERPGSVGRALPPLVDIAIVDPSGQPCPPMEEGEVLIHGAMNFTCYWNDPEATARTIRKGWVHTGDLGYCDSEGFLFLTGRLKDMVNRGGEKVNCQEVETAILAHDAIHDAVVFGLPDERLGEVVGCLCEIRPGQVLTDEALKAFLAERLAHFKLPERIWLQYQPLPRLASGKIDRRAAKAQYSSKNGQAGEK